MPSSADLKMHAAYSALSPATTAGVVVSPPYLCRMRVILGLRGMSRRQQPFRPLRLERGPCGSLSGQKPRVALGPIYIPARLFQVAQACGARNGAIDADMCSISHQGIKSGRRPAQQNSRLEPHTSTSRWTKRLACLHDAAPDMAGGQETLPAMPRPASPF